MNLIIVLLTAALIVNCLILILLVLMQLPKKEAGSGLAFGAGASDALFGSGSGNVLTKATKYAAGLFLGMSLLLGMMNSHAAKARREGVGQLLGTQVLPVIAPVAPPTNSQFLQIPLTTTNAVVPAPKSTTNK